MEKGGVADQIRGVKEFGVCGGGVGGDHVGGGAGGESGGWEGGAFVSAKGGGGEEGKRNGGCEGEHGDRESRQGRVTVRVEVGGEGKLGREHAGEMVQLQNGKRKCRTGEVVFDWTAEVQMWRRAASRASFI